MDNNGQTVYDLSIASLKLDKHDLKQKVKDAVLKKIISDLEMGTKKKRLKAILVKNLEFTLRVNLV